MVIGQQSEIGLPLTAESMCMGEYTALNSARDMSGSIHDDKIAAALGYKGGLVSGVAFTSYVVDALRASAGIDVYSGGSLSMQFGKPIYEGDQITIQRLFDESLPPGDARLVLLDEDGVSCAQYQFSQSGALDEVPFDLESSEASRKLTRCFDSSFEERYLSCEYLDDFPLTPSTSDVDQFLLSVGLDRNPWKEQGLVHPAYLFRTYADACRSNRVLEGSPSIHMNSAIRFGAPVKLDEPLRICGRIDCLFSRKGNRYLVLDLQWVRTRDSRLVMTDHHTVIYQKRAIA